MDVGTLFFGFKGRINRAKWWLAVLIYFVIGLILQIIVQAVEESFAVNTLNLIVNVALFISALAVGSKCLHDRDKSGWWLLLLYITPTVLIMIGTLSYFYGIGAESDAAVIVGGVFNLVSLGFLIWMVVELGCLRGTIGANKYGPDLLAPAA